MKPCQGAKKLERMGISRISDLTSSNVDEIELTCTCILRKEVKTWIWSNSPKQKNTIWKYEFFRKVFTRWNLCRSGAMRSEGSTAWCGRALLPCRPCPGAAAKPFCCFTPSRGAGYIGPIGISWNYVRIYGYLWHGLIISRFSTELWSLHPSHWEMSWLRNSLPMEDLEH